MKKILSLILVAVMLTFALASCKTDPAPQKQPTPKETRYTITADEWAALQNEYNYTVVITHTSTQSDGTNTETSSSTYTIKSTATGLYTKYEYELSGSTGTSEYYYTIIDGVRYQLIYRETEERWIASQTGWENSSIIDDLGLDDELKFEDLVYDETKKAYTYTVEGDEVTGVATFYFEDGKLVKLTTEASGEFTEGGVIFTASAVETYIISNMGTTEITLPEYTMD